ncbi:hypothetical protein K504DRAFT_231773 [Pleomassaria siparia CBS 279.74]|uniref:Uncharacterized protein n=1 Tax=Pleomassaria siparia CBS 279.74 TaxID=1314801 RepID=A0A6G1KGX3_9PLEO|nr:hypothetical protein K504DRAFT_231773 [Pleomassaria siparia CBS 279.74]
MADCRYVAIDAAPPAGPHAVPETAGGGPYVVFVARCNDTQQQMKAKTQTVNHISQDGLVPIVTHGEAGKKCRRYHELVEISAPIHKALPEYVIVVLLDDLHLFCQVWFYSALSYPALNDHLRTTFVLQDPYYPADPKPIPLALQRRLLFPFEKVKGLYEVEMDGFDERVKQELKTLMAKPNDTVQKCCEDATELMEKGDGELAAGKAKKALESYSQSFKTIHILIDGRTRRVLGDPFFHDGIQGGRYTGQSGTTVRIILRIKLVSRTVHAYIKMQQWEEAAFWGMRSIRIMREAMETEFEGFLTEFVGADDTGLLYLRAAIAMRKMEENGSDELAHYLCNGENSERLFLLTKKYMKGKWKAVVKKECEAVGMEVPTDIFGKDLESDMDSLRHMNEQESDGETE